VHTHNHDTAPRLVHGKHTYEHITSRSSFEVFGYSTTASSNIVCWQHAKDRQVSRFSKTVTSVQSGS
jgi:hypothetical protein